MGEARQAGAPAASALVRRDGRSAGFVTIVGCALAVPLSQA
jgi:hypothetical protein